MNDETHGKYTQVHTDTIQYNTVQDNKHEHTSGIRTSATMPYKSQMTHAHTYTHNAPTLKAKNRSFCFKESEYTWWRLFFYFFFIHFFGVLALQRCVISECDNICEQSQ